MCGVATHPVPDSLAGPAQGQAEPAQEIAVETAAVTALRVLSTDTNTLRTEDRNSILPCMSHCCVESDQAVNVGQEGKGLSLCDCDCAMD